MSINKGGNTSSQFNQSAQNKQAQNIQHRNRFNFASGANPPNKQAIKQLIAGPNQKIQPAPKLNHPGPGGTIQRKVDAQTHTRGLAQTAAASKAQPKNNTLARDMNTRLKMKQSLLKNAHAKAAAPKQEPKRGPSR